LNDASIAKNAELVKSLGFKKASQHPDYSATWQIREEEWKKYTYVERWGDVDDTKIKDGAPVKGKKLVPFAPARVYNVAQIDGVPPAVKMELEWTPLEIGEKILKDSGARIEHGASIASIWFDATDEYRAFYDRGEDYIQMPGKERFKEPGLYYAVALHELSHWSGHPTRLNRDMTGRFGSAAYAREELRAEISSMYISAEIGIPVYPSRVAAYAQSWLKAIKDDPNAVFQACSDATKMAEYVISLSPELKLRLDEQREMMKPTVEPSVAIAAPALV
jgi:antirestriction protein ArdC